MKKITVVLVSVLLLSSINTFAQTNILGQNLYNMAVPFLTIAPDARAGAMGDMGVATSSDVNSQAYNPAKYVFSKNMFGVSVSYSPWLRNLVNDINLAYLAGYWKITDKDAIGASLRYFSLGFIDFMDEWGGTVSAQKPKEFSVDFTYSRKLIDQLSIAITPRFIYTDIQYGQFIGEDQHKAGLAGAADLSLFYEQDFRVTGLSKSTLRAGLCISNITFMKMSYSRWGTNNGDFLPTNLKLGIGYEMDFDNRNKLSITGEINKLLVPTIPIYQTNPFGQIMYDENGNPMIYAGKDPNVSAPMGMIQSFYDAPGGFKEEMQEVMCALGAEYSYRDFFFARLGYFHESPNKRNRHFLSFGVGLKYNIFGIDMSYLFDLNGQYSPLANTLRFTASFDFVSADKNEIKLQGRPWYNSAKGKKEN